MSFDNAHVRKQFPALMQQVHHKPLVYLDSAATAQKPQCVLDGITAANTLMCANVHRGVHLLSARATTAFEGTRKKVQAFLNAPAQAECIFVRGTTEAINLVANTFGTQSVHKGDAIVISQLEHHSNIVPWQMLCRAQGATLRVVPINDAGEIDMDAYLGMLDDTVRLVAVSHVSNSLGTVLPIKQMVQAAHAHGIKVLVDGAQAVPHVPVDVQDLGCDFYTFSAHKLYGPSGTGVLWGKKELLESMPPWQGGGDMIMQVSFEKTTYAPLPHKFEAGTPDIAGVIGLGQALDFINSIDWQAGHRYEQALLAYGTELLQKVEGLRFIGTAQNKVSVLSFLLESAHPHDIGTILDREGIAIRTGHHCAQPVMKRFGVAATARASLGIYNNEDDLDRLAKGLHKVQRMFAAQAS